MSKKDCMFQYLTVGEGMFGSYKSIEDTDLITRKQAEDLWLKYVDEFRVILEGDWANPEMGIWINCKDNTDYHTSVAHLDRDTKWDGRRFYREVIEFIEVPKPKSKKVK